MANFVYFYNIAICDGSGNITNKSIKVLFDKIEKILEKDEIKVVRKVGDDVFSIFSYYRHEFIDKLAVIPIAKLKDKEIPLTRDDKDPKKLVPLPKELYDVNSLVYHDKHKVMIYTANKSGPKIEDVVAYLNTFFKKEDGYNITIRPIIYDTGLVKLRNAKQVRNITFTLDLETNLNNFYLKRKQNEKEGLFKAMQGFISMSKNEIGSNTLKFTMSVGQKGDTLDKEVLLDLLEYINLDSSYVKEIEFNYTDDSTEKVTPAKIKKPFYKLSGSFKKANKQLSSEYLKDNADELFSKKRDFYSSEVDRFFESCKQDEDDSYTLNEDWREMKESEV
ncbi:MAG: hypothetical protein PHG19_04760 [Anaerotignum sp.]|nr:hypothetical protein [Anaerotignum sp.]